VRVSLFFISMVTSFQVSAQVPESVVKRMKETTAVNINEIVDDLRLSNDGKPRKFRLRNPYASGVDNSAPEFDEVCALRFIEGSETEYELRNFTTRAFAEIMGYRVTHYGRCGACSTLKDLAVYIEQPNLKDPAKSCGMRLIPQLAKRCFKRKIGFTRLCAEAWTYNTINTRKKCWKPCLFGGEDNSSPCELSECLECDEVNSGPGFKHVAGRIRRNSGLDSAIPRCDGEVRSELDHTSYWPSTD
jgi:hypothetical protein